MPAPTSPIRTLLASRSTQRWFFVAAGVVTSALYIFGAWQSRFNLSNVDGISYISIAKQYAAGLTEYAINGYWSPFVSWFMAPFIAAGVEPLFSFVLINAFAAIVNTCVAMLLVYRLTRGHFWATFIVLVTTFALQFAQAPTITPDAWVVSWTTLFAWVLLEVDRRLRPGTVRERIIAGIVIGAMGALGFFIKQYLIPVFVVVVIAWFIFRWFADRAENREPDNVAAARRWWITPVATLAAALIISAPWITALSIKYGELTLGSSFAVNISVKFDPDSETRTRDPLQLVTPPNEYAVAFGEDRSYEVAETSEFGTERSLLSRIKYYVVERFAVFPYYLEKLGSFAPFAFVIYAGMLAALLFGWANFRRHRESVSILIVGLVYFAGYAAITQVSSSGGNARYYWPALTISTILLCISLPALWKRFFADASRWRRILAICLVALVPFAAVTQNMLGLPYVFSTVKATGGAGFLFKEPGKPIPYVFAEELKKDGVIPKRSKLVGSNYRLTLRLAYYLDAQAYGRSGHNFDLTDPAFREVLDENDIDYFLRFTPTGDPRADVSEFATIVKTYDTRVTCSDERSAPVTDCTVDIISLK